MSAKTVPPVLSERKPHPEKVRSTGGAQPYRRGVAKEQLVVEHLVAHGWVAGRSAGSHGPADVVALKDGEQPQLIQVKYGTGNRFKGFPPAERQALLTAAQIAGARPVLCRWYPDAEAPEWIDADEWPRLDIRTSVEYVVDVERGCWIWQRGCDAQGYGKVTRKAAGQTHYLAHRFHYAERYGPIPEDLEIDHLCRTPRCVNPEHLELVDKTENVRRGRVAKLTPEHVAKIKASRLPVKHLATIYGVSWSQIYNIRSGKAWQDVLAA